MEEYYGEYWYLAFLLSAVLTWGIGLAPPLLLRFAILKRPISKKVAITLVVLFWFINVVIFTALGSTSKTHSALFFVAWASFAILRKGSQKQKREERPINIKEDMKATGETISDEKSNNAVNHTDAHVKQKIVGTKKCPYCAEEIQSETVKCRFCGEEQNQERTINHYAKQKIVVIDSLVILSLIFGLGLILSTIRPFSSIAEEKSAHPETPTSGEGLLADLVADIQQRRSLSTPSQRLVGRWRNVDNNGEIYFSPIESELRLGTYRLHNQGGRVGPPTRIRILRENVSGTELFYKEYKNLSIKKLEIAIGLDLTKSDIRCCVSTDGTMMTLEYAMGSSQMFSVYQYIDNEPLAEQSFTDQSAGPAPLLPDPVSNPIGYWVILASKGDVNAMHQLGNIYEQRKDKSSAKRWYGRAAKQGHRISQEAMSRLRE